MTNAESSSGRVSRKAKLEGEGPVNVGRNYNGPKVHCISLKYSEGLGLL